MKSVEEFNVRFDVEYNNITSNQAPGLNSLEKSIFLTKAQNELVKNYFDASSKGNSIGKGFDEGAIRQMDFSTLMESTELPKSADSPVMDYRALVYNLPSNVLIIINEEIALKGGVKETTTTTYYKWNGTDNIWVNQATLRATLDDKETTKGTVASVDNLPKTNLTDGDIYAVTTTTNSSDVLSTRQVIPVSYQEYMRLMSKPFKEPLKWQAWRLMTKGSSANGITSNKVEIVLSSYDKQKYTTYNYILRYVRKPVPIILEDLGEYKIEGKSSVSMCELDESTHDAIVQRAVELAKIAWAGDMNDIQTQVTSGQRSE